MDEPHKTGPLLNIFEVEEDGRARHLVCFVDPVIAGSRGIDQRAVVGEFKPGADDEFDAETFEVNSDFIEALQEYMNDRAMTAVDLMDEAMRHPGEALFVLDPRYEADEGAEPPVAELLGAYSVDESGRIVPGSFLYNLEHVLFDLKAGPSAVLFDQQFYDWLHSDPDDD